MSPNISVPMMEGNWDHCGSMTQMNVYEHNVLMVRRVRDRVVV